jgi:hypothetical protein
MARWSKPKRAPASLSEDRFDKFIAAMSWYVGRDKSDAGSVGVVRAPADR